MNLKELAKARGTNLKKVAEQTGIPASTLYAISQGGSNFESVGIDIFIKVADALGMSVEDLRELPNVTPENVEYYLVTIEDSDQERELLELFDKMDDVARDALLSTARALVRR